MYESYNHHFIASLMPMGKDSLQNITCPLKAMEFQTLFKKTSFIYLLRRGPGYLWSFQDNSGCLAD